ncbi:crossover junction endodeoxyribonuclease RuvC [Candidatus Woesebacteria bacterium]|nr:crossover junction endodeoxyribonuclease RuvC [Candidatus Woesebacteria bacterium]
MTAKPFRQLILGIDPGYDRCGWAIVAQQNTALKAVEYGCVQTSAKDEKADRFRQIWRQMDHLFAQYPIDVIAIESLFFFAQCVDCVAGERSTGTDLRAVISPRDPRGRICPEYHQNGRHWTRQRPQRPDARHGVPFTET